MLTEQLLDAYRCTTYRVRLPDGDLDMRIDTVSPRLLALHARHAVQSSAFVTAFNPRSKQLDFSQNERRQAALLGLLEAFGLASYPGDGIGDDPTWAPEPSILVLGVTLQQARSLGSTFEQNAVVWAGEDGVPKLQDTSAA